MSYGVNYVRQWSSSWTRGLVLTVREQMPSHSSLPCLLPVSPPAPVSSISGFYPVWEPIPFSLPGNVHTLITRNVHITKNQTRHNAGLLLLRFCDVCIRYCATFNKVLSVIIPHLFSSRIDLLFFLLVFWVRVKCSLFSSNFLFLSLPRGVEKARLDECIH